MKKTIRISLIMFMTLSDKINFCVHKPKIYHPKNQNYPHPLILRIQSMTLTHLWKLIKAQLRNKIYPTQIVSITLEMYT